MIDKYKVKKNSKTLFVGTHNECFGWLLDNQSQSVDWAIKYEGYSITEVLVGGRYKRITGKDNKEYLIKPNLEKFKELKQDRGDDSGLTETMEDKL